MTTDPNLRAAIDVIVAGHQGDAATVLAGVESDDAFTRRAALFALARLKQLTDDQLLRAFKDPDPQVRIGAAELAASHPEVNVTSLLSDDDYLVVEMAAWACGERAELPEETFAALLRLGTDHEQQLVREAAIAALGALGDPRALPVILKGCKDKPAVRRRAVLALAPFDGPEVEAAIDEALKDKDWQVRQSAEDLRR